MGYKIKEVRKEKHMTQRELAEKTGISRAIISVLESGRITVNTMKTLLKISEALQKK